ncbi:LOW QUALITY PROTEIN: piggyBac transposable element-derived protein 4-like [Sphaeramia orbicularis]|uniref:LOW QUALITY PROTEIN: piggyBac transposable element-derived protein 4-like n=1 Tax=Sphaeramia orbicularis TaxID=375764 RepID=UPI00117CD7D5|nr:LOW QUALITY PROTEIN: piggyBac transposable element-derived protein 4-like [Sphaeramia orbicularis]
MRQLRRQLGKSNWGRQGRDGDSRREKAGRLGPAHDLSTDTCLSAKRVLGQTRRHRHRRSEDEQEERPKRMRGKDLREESEIQRRERQQEERRTRQLRRQLEKSDWEQEERDGGPEREDNLSSGTHLSAKRVLGETQREGHRRNDDEQEEKTKRVSKKREEEEEEEEEDKDEDDEDEESETQWRERQQEERRTRQLRRQPLRHPEESDQEAEGPDVREGDSEQENATRPASADDLSFEAHLSTKGFLGEPRREGPLSEGEEEDEEQQPQQPWPPGPTALAVSKARDVISTFYLFLTPEIDKIILEETNREGLRKRGRDGWRHMDEIDLHAYVGPLILAGVYRSRGKATASLWDAESGRAIFRATMSLKVFHLYSKLLRFDDRETRAERHTLDKLAAIRKLWDAWVERLPALYNPGPHVTVDEQLVPFRGRCPFRQYMPSKPAKYGIKSWVACDPRSSYAWKMQVYTGKPAAGGWERGTGAAKGSEKNQAMRVVLDVTEGLTGRNVTCDNFFTSYELAGRLLRERNNTLLGTIRKNKPELPTALLELRGRRVLSSKFAFTPDTTLVSYVPKKNKNVLLLSTLHARAPDVRPVRSDVVLDYNANKGGVDNLDKVVGSYSCRRMTARWPLVVFHNIVNVSGYNAFVIWRELNPGWMPGKCNKRRVFLEQLGKALVAPLIERRPRLPSAESAASVVKAVSKRKRCQVFPSKKDCKMRKVCCRC